MASKPIYKVPQGSELILDQRRWRVVGKDRDGYAVECNEDGECLTLSFERVDNAIAAKDAQLITPKMAESRKKLLEFTGGIERVEQLPQAERHDVRARLGIMVAMDKLEEEGVKLTQRYLSRRDVRQRLRHLAIELSGEKNLFRDAHIGSASLPHVLPKGRKLQEMRRTFQTFDRNPVVLMRRHHKKGWQKGRSRLCLLGEQFIDYVLNCFCDPRQVKLGKLYKGAKSKFNVPEDAVLSGFEFPSIVTVRKRAAALDKLIKEIGQNGHRYARNKYGAGSTNIRALKYGEYCATDQMYLSIFTNSKGEEEFKKIEADKEGTPLKAGEIRRLWLFYMIDVATRMPLAWLLADTADADHQNKLLRMAMRVKTREKVRYECEHDPAPPVKPKMVRSDNGTAARNADMYASQLGMGINIMTGRAYNSVDNSYAERALAPVQWKLLNFLPGYTGSRPGELNGYDGQKNAEITPDDLMGRITRFFVDEVPHSEHKGTGMNRATPKQKLDETIEMYGGIDAPDPEMIRLHFGEKATATTTSEGVRIFNIPYNSTALQKFAAGDAKKVTVCLDPDDLRHVTILNEENTDVITADLRMTVFADLTLEEAITDMRSAVEANPEKRALHNEHLKAARARRVKESGFFPDSNLPSSYTRIEELRRQADQMAHVECISMVRTGPTIAPGSIMDRSSTTSPMISDAPQQGENMSSGNAEPHSTSSQTPSRTQEAATDTTLETQAVRTFKPITESKL
ncbi:transposase family protein [Aliiroseovarius sp. S1339]|uniref:transposase family protein n=1 Tax=Aliiroseovarius sp. S1339 TaxID=2936990 RepID=UPI0020BFF5DF|nr:transposase family protein [Aliiroseovarius sp. S1339]MCK8463206.1 transposase family protein [Aliiroseovarius sp. S1339]